MSFLIYRSENTATICCIFLSQLQQFMMDFIWSYKAAESPCNSFWYTDMGKYIGQ